MTTRILVAPSAARKPYRIIEIIQSTQQARPLAAVRVVLPDWLQAGQFRPWPVAHGGAIGVEVVTFGDLCQMLLFRAGRPIPHGAGPIAKLLIRELSH